MYKKSDRIQKIDSELEIIVNDSNLLEDKKEELFRKRYMAFCDFSSDNIHNDSSVVNRINRLIEMNEISKEVGISLLPIGRDISDYSEPMFISIGDEEIDSDLKSRLLARREKNYISFPMCFFSNSFFELDWGENCAFLPNIESMEETTGTCTVAFFESDCDEDIIEYILTSLRICRFLIIKDHLSKDLSMLEEKYSICDVSLSNEMNLFDRLCIITECKALLRECFEIYKIIEKINKLIEECNSNIISLRDKSAKVADAKIRKSSVEDMSTFAVNIDLKYGKIKKDLLQFSNRYLEEFASTENGILSKDVIHLLEETISNCENDVANLSMIGVFSSGKTTLINKCLGQREIPLRTSMNHNTAVLMQLIYEKSEKEYYELKYKKNVEWTLVRPTFYPKKIHSKSDIIVENIQKKNGSILFTYINLDTKKEENKRYRDNLNFCVKKGDKINKGGLIAQTRDNESENVEICSISEIEVIIDQVENCDEYELFCGAKSIEKEDIRTILSAIKSVAKEKTSNIPYSSFHEAMNSYNVKEVDFKRVFFKCKNYKTDKRIDLNRDGWIELCGRPDLKQDVNVPFSERAECYVLSEKLILHVHSEFLQYCSIVDTPGFGSITEEHDACTERYITNNAGRLLVMIPINSKTEDSKLQDFLFNIDDIYSNNRNNDKKNVMFLLNCFKETTTVKQIQTNINRIVEKIEDYGFNKELVFVCNLKDALDNNIQDNMYGYKSYKLFYDFVINEMINKELDNKYRKIVSCWRDFLNSAVNNKKYKMSEEEAKNRKVNIEKNNNKLKELEVIKENIENRKDEIFDFEKEFKENCDNVITSFESNTSGYFLKKEKNRWKELENNLENIFKIIDAMNEELKQKIDDYYSNIIDEIKEILDYDEQYENIDCQEEDIKILVSIEQTTLKNTIKEANKNMNFNLFKPIKEKEKIQKEEVLKIKQRFASSLSNSQKEVREYCKNRDDICKKLLSRATAKLEAEKKLLKEKDTEKVNKILRDELERLLVMKDSIEKIRLC